MDSPPDRSESEVGPRAWAALALLLAAALSALRATLVLRVALEHRGLEPWGAAWRTSRELPPALLHAAVTGLVVGALAVALRRTRGGPWLAGALSAPLFLWVLAGVPYGHPAYTPGLESDAGIAGWALLAAASVLLASLVVAASRLLSRPGPVERLLSGRVALLVGLLAFTATPLTVVALRGDPAPAPTVTEIVRDLAADPDGWVVEEEDLEHPIAAATLSPKLPRPQDGGDRPGLRMAPPARVTLPVRASDGPVRVRPAYTVNARTFARLRNTERYAVRFDVEVDGEVVHSDVVRVYRKAEPADREWRYAGGEEGLLLRPGQTLTLATEIERADTGGRPAAGVVGAGFADLFLEREIELDPGPATPERPNVLLVVMDTLRADHLSCYGHELETSPTIDALAERGTLFERAYATSSWTWPSAASILTGRWPETHGVTSERSCQLPQALDTLPEVLAREGYVTGAFSCNPLIVEERNFGQGLAHLDQAERFRKTDEVLPAIDRWLAQIGDRRFFLYLHLVDPHTPPRPSPAALRLVGAEAPADFPGEDGTKDYHLRLARGEGNDDEARRVDPSLVVPDAHRRWIQDAYLASVATADEYVADVLELLGGLDALEDTLVVFTSDHGEEMFQHGMITHGHTLYEELVHVPLLFAGPGVEAGVRREVPVSNRHVAPTLARRAGATLRGVEEPLDLLELGPDAERPLFFSTHNGWWNGRRNVVVHGMREGAWVLHDAPEGLPWGAPEDADPGDGEVRLFDLDADPGQTRDVAAEHPERVARMRAALAEHVVRTRAARPTSGVAASADTLEMLREIGYIDDE